MPSIRRPCGAHMGGFGSGRYYYSSAPTCKSSHSIDLAWLRRRGMLEPGRYSLAWSRAGEPSGSIGIVAQADGERLLYWVTDSNGGWISVDELVPFRDSAPIRGGTLGQGQQDQYDPGRCIGPDRLREHRSLH